MENSEIIIRVIGTDECPLYKVGDEFRVSGKSLNSPYGKAACLILLRDMTDVLMKYNLMDSNARYIFDCSGCTGLARLEYKKSKKRSNGKLPENEIRELTAMLDEYPFFQIFDEDTVRRLMTVLEKRKFEAGEVVIHKGDPEKMSLLLLKDRWKFWQMTA